MSLVLGFAAETQARDFLAAKGLIWVESNFRCRMGEIDLIMKDQDTLVFVEVRQRHSKSYGSALESITDSKLQKLEKTASIYLMSKNLMDKIQTRFDVISVEGKTHQLIWIKNAFDAMY